MVVVRPARESEIGTICEFLTTHMDATLSAERFRRLPGVNCAAVMRDKLGQIDRLIATLTDRRHVLSERLAAQERVAMRQGDRVNEDPEHTGAPLSSVGGF